MKKLFPILLLTILGSLLLTGCASNAGALATPTPRANGAQNGMMPSLTATKSPAMDATDRPAATGMPSGNVGVQTPEDARNASQSMEEAIERLSEVSEASVIALGDTALVGVKFGPEYQGKADDRIKKMVLARAQTVDKTIRSVAVTDDVKLIQDIQALTETLGSALSLEPLQSQVNDLVRQITVYTE